MKRIIRLTESDLTRIVRRVIKESLSEGERVIWYNKCEGGIGKIDPNSFIFNGKQIDEKTKEERDVILFEKEPNLEYNEGDSKTIPTCLGEDRPLTGRCFNIFPCGENQECATYEVDCETKKNLW